jgi:hypothetical protein
VSEGSRRSAQGERGEGARGTHPAQRKETAWLLPAAWISQLTVSVRLGALEMPALAWNNVRVLNILLLKSNYFRKSYPRQQLHIEDFLDRRLELQ